MQMEFTPTRALHSRTGNRADMWLPDPHFEDYGDPQDDIMEIMIGNERRFALTALLQLTSTYTKEAEQRTRLGQDCVVFAYAWESGQSCTETLFNRDDGLGVKPNLLEYSRVRPLRIPRTEPGQIVFTANAAPYGNFIHRDPHFLVHATTDSAEPLYLSKLGSTGPVVLSTLEQSLRFYPAKTLGIASNFTLVPASKPRTAIPKR